jgi:geranylgeranyl reductase family protein
MKKYEVIVVGGGPAGSTAAYFLAQAGVKVCIIDKQSFPRDKVCGDGVVGSILTRLEGMGMQTWLEANSFNAPREILFSAPNGQAAHILPDDRDRCYGRVIPRLKLDKAILHQAMKAGAELQEGVKLTGLTRLSPHQIQLSAEQPGSQTKLHLESQLLITADGAHASFTRQLGLVKGVPDLVAIRAYFENVEGPESLLEIHYDKTLMPGYAWIFPMTNGQANIGLGTYVQRSRQRNVDLKETLRQFLQHNPYARQRLSQARMVGPLRGHPLRSQMRTVTPLADNILVTGEAAGLVNPLNGEGIGTAIISGELAARQAQLALAAGNFSKSYLSPYAQALRQTIGRNHAIANVLRQMLSMPGVLNRAVRRAQHDHDFAQTLFSVIVEIKPPSAILSPGFMLKLIAG